MRKGGDSSSAVEKTRALSARQNARLRERLNELLAARGMSERRLAEVAGVSIGSVRSIGRTPGGPTLGTLLAIARALSLDSLDSLLGASALAKLTTPEPRDATDIDRVALRATAAPTAVVALSAEHEPTTLADEAKLFQLSIGGMPLMALEAISHFQQQAASDYLSRIVGQHLESLLRDELVQRDIETRGAYERRLATTSDLSDARRKTRPTRTSSNLKESDVRKR